MAPELSPRIAHLERFLQQDSSDAFTRYALALEYSAIGQYELARGHFSYLIHHNPSYLATYYHYGRLLRELNETANAESVFRAGMAVAQQKRDSKTLAEIKGELSILLGIDEDEL